MSAQPGGIPAERVQGRDAAWIAYILHAIGYLTMMMWPALIGLIVNYVKRGDAKGSIVESHHRWMIRTFWYGSLWQTVSLVVLLWSAWPILSVVLQQVSTSGDALITWNTILAVLGAATLGVAGLIVTWFWLLYRVIRGAIHLVNLESVP